jgi:hypothetical protein
MSGMTMRSESRIFLAGAGLLYGSVWGLGEATLGHLLHLARVPGLPGLVMLPFGAVMISGALRRSGRAEAPFLAGVVASGFKMLDMLIPGTGLLAIINPVRAILLEAATVSVIAVFFGRATTLGPPFRRFLSPAGHDDLIGND